MVHSLCGGGATRGRGVVELADLAGELGRAIELDLVVGLELPNTAYQVDVVARLPPLGVARGGGEGGVRQSSKRCCLSVIVVGGYLVAPHRSRVPRRYHQHNHAGLGGMWCGLVG